MRQEIKDVYIVVGARGEPGAEYRRALSGLPNSLCIGLDRNDGSQKVYWDARDKNLLHVNWRKTCDETIHAELGHAIETRAGGSPKRITVLFAGGRERGEDGADARHERRRKSACYSFDALTLKNIVAIAGELAEKYSADVSSPVALNVAAVSSMAVAHPKAGQFPDYTVSKLMVESFIEKFVDLGKAKPNSNITHSGLVLRAPATFLPERHGSYLGPKDLVKTTLPHITSMRSGNYAILNVGQPQPSPWRAQLGAVIPMQSLPVSSLGVPHKLWAGMVQAGRLKEANGAIGAGT